MDARRIVATYLFTQAVGIAAWWVLLVSYPPSMEWFQPESWPHETLLAYWLADLGLLAGGSCLAASGVLKQKRWATTAVWALAAVAWYPTLVCIATSVMTDEAWVASATMVSMAGLMLAMATIHGSSTQLPAAIRVTSMSKAAALTWTLGQTLVFWSVFLWILPMAIVDVERRVGWPIFSHAGQAVGATALFGIASAVGLWSGITMATRGDGTPLQTATAPNLVIAGPYRYVRNPMALAGVLQGVAVGWYLGSYGVVVYSMAGAIVWHGFVRPVEERDLLQRFGESYSRYKQRVRLWLPSI